MAKWEPKIYIEDHMLKENERWNELEKKEQELADVKTELRLTLDALRTKDIELYDLKALVRKFQKDLEWEVWEQLKQVVEEA